MIHFRDLEKSDKIIVGISSLCAVMLFSWLVYDILYFNHELKGQVEIGEIYQAKNKVKRKFNKSLIWYDANSHEIVYEDDWIFTGSQSLAKIKLHSGGEIIVEPDSLIVLSRQNGVLQLELQHGRLLADVKQNKIDIKVLSQGKMKKVNTKKGVFRITKKANQPELEKVEEIKLPNADKQDSAINISDLIDKEYFKPQQGFTPLDEIGISFKKDSITNAELFPGQSTQSKVEWQDPNKKWSSYEVQVASDHEFKNVISNKKTEKPNYIFKTQKPGDYAWRIRGIDKNGQIGQWSKKQSSQVNINYLKKQPAPLFAKKSLTYQLNRDELKKKNIDNNQMIHQNKPINIKWQPIQKAEKYQVLFAKDKNFSDVIKTTETKQPQVSLDKLKVGKTYFKVVPQTIEGIPVAEEATGQVFSQLPAPTAKSLKTKSWADQQTIQWEPIPYAKTYEVRYKTSKESNKDHVKYVRGTQVKIENDSGYLQWKVRAVDSKTKEPLSLISKTVDWYDKAKQLAAIHQNGQAGVHFPTIVKPAPRKTYLAMNNSPLFIVVEWNFKQKVNSYQLEISRTADMKKLVYRKKVTSHRAVIRKRFKQGIYYMRVRALGRQPAQATWSETEVFRVIHQQTP